MKLKTKKIILESLFDIKEPFNNLLYGVMMMMLAAFMKLGLILKDPIIEGGVFQVWMWAFTMIILTFIIVYIFGKLEGIFILGGISLLLIIILPPDYFELRIAVFLFVVGLFGSYWYKHNGMKDIKKPLKHKQNSTKSN